MELIRTVVGIEDCDSERAGGVFLLNEEELVGEFVSVRLTMSDSLTLRHTYVTGHEPKIKEATAQQSLLLLTPCATLYHFNLHSNAFGE